MEGIPERSHEIRWLYWNGTACINSVSSVVIKFTTRFGMLEDISASVQYVNITNRDYSRKFYRFNAIFVDNSASLGVVEARKPLGYDVGQSVRIDGTSGAAFLIPFGLECTDKKQQVEIRFGIQVNTACRIRITTCAEVSTQIRDLLQRWKAAVVYKSPYSENETLTIQTDKLPSQTNEMDESCELTTAASIRFAYVRIGNVLAYSHRLISYEIDFNKPDIIDLTTYPYQYIYFNFIVYFIDQTIPSIKIFAKTPTMSIALPADFFYPFFE
uniref:Uncharacterized protein n=1 Tax=Setaria digitata TaxID=48799 RepID=A0A915Q241_9BILA